jgi:hypothetical protein
MDFQQGGQSPCFMVQQAAMAVAQGYAENVLVFRALNGRSGVRVGSAPLAGGAGQFRYPIGYSAYLMYIAMWARRYMHETGATTEDLASVAIAQRAYATRNERAILRKPLDLETYLDSPMIADPLRAADCSGLYKRGGRSLRRTGHLGRPGPVAAPPSGADRIRRLPGGPPARSGHRRPAHVQRLHAQLHRPAA